jgi:hypothetical protein
VSRAKVIGNLRFDIIDRTASLPLVMPALLALAAIGFVAIVRAPTQGNRPTLAVMRPLVLGAAGAWVLSITIVYITQRFTADFVPLLVLGSLPGLQLLLRRGDEGRHLGYGLRIGAVVLAALSVWSCYTNFSLALVYQRSLAPLVPEQFRAEFIGFQQDLDQRLGHDHPTGVRTGQELPRPGPEGDLFIVGHCGGLYWSDGSRWAPVERTKATGRFHLRVRFPDRPSQTREPLLASISPEGSHVIFVEYLNRDHVVFAHGTRGSDAVGKGISVPIKNGHTYNVDLVLDRRVSEVGVWLDGRFVLGGSYSSSSNDAFTVGRSTFGDATVARFTGIISNIAVRAPVCRDLRDRLDSSG